MRCRYSEQDIALYVEGDLGDGQAVQIQAHLLICDECRVLEADLLESQAIFKSVRQEAVSAAALTQVRNRVLAEVAGVGSRTAWGRKLERWLWLGLRRGYALAGVGMIAVTFVGLWYSRVSDPLPATPAVPLSRGTVGPPTAEMVPTPAVPLWRGTVDAVEPVAVAETPAVPLREGDSGRGAPRPQGVARAVTPKPADPDPIAEIASQAEPPPQLVVKLLTDDPNIVIYWLVDKNGD